MFSCLTQKVLTQKVGCPEILGDAMQKCKPMKHLPSLSRIGLICTWGPGTLLMQEPVKAAEKNPAEASAGEAEDAPAPAPKKQKSQLFKAPEAAEVVEIARTRNLYKSNLFRLQLEDQDWLVPDWTTAWSHKE
ncbi:hypothetical protein AK812_SmicGene1004 [Symbiodinium microadriaticum]|uniref:Uncharacterized protein n=1 Tax=Symbiodinium microadriaticum TaxID=2951 RepID=A0A1Q9F552_SYMMI|nr:hypothetical protein AK812_SmicGene1004 [Symbiodinium microadriaticum]